MSYNLSTGNDYADSIFSNIAQTFVTNTLSRNNLITTGKPPAGNLSEKELSQGKSGAVPQGSSANNTGVLNSLGVNFSGSSMPLYIAGGVLVLVVVYFAMKR